MLFEIPRHKMSIAAIWAQISQLHELPSSVGRSKKSFWRSNTLFWKGLWDQSTSKVAFQVPPQGFGIGFGRQRESQMAGKTDLGALATKFYWDNDFVRPYYVFCRFWGLKDNENLTWRQNLSTCIGILHGERLRNAKRDPRKEAGMHLGYLQMGLGTGIG